jgi:putative NADH-flavin reductase
MLNTEAAFRKLYFGGAMASRLWVAFQVLVTIACASLMIACASPGTAPVPAPEIAVEGEEGEHRTVALLGGSGMVGDYLLREALARGYAVRVLARTPVKLSEFADQIAIVQGDALDPAAVATLLRGSDVVISALGPVKADGDAALYINTTATGNVLQAMQGEEISLYMVVSGAAVVMPGDQRNLLGWWIRTLAQTGLSDAVQDKQAEYELLATSSADWMLVRCPLVDSEAFRWAPLVSTQTPPAFRVRAGEVARFMIDQVEARQFVREAPFLGSR